MGCFVIFLFASLFYVTLAGKHDVYRGYIVYGVKLEDQVDQEVLYGLQSELDLDLWEYGVPKVKDVLVMVSPDKKERFLDILDKNYIKHYLHLSDVAQALEENDNDLSSWERESSRVFEKYARYAEIDAYLEEVAQAHPQIVTLVNAGLSFEGRPVKYLKISTSNFTDPSKPVYFIDAAMHAREWITIPPALYSIHRLVEDLREQDRDLLEEIDWIVMPLVNPDGYEYTHTQERLWRKTRSFNVTRHPECYGVDANRNFDVDFYGTGSSTNPCVNTFRGHEPFSEPETRCVRNVILEHIDRLQVYLNVHSHGNLILYGYGNKTLPSNVVQLHQVGAIMGAAIDHKKLLEAPYYLVGNSALVLYTSSGSAQDYGQVVGVPFSYTLELPGMGYGFQIPVRFVNQVNMETWEGIAASARIAKIYYRARDQK